MCKFQKIGCEASCVYAQMEKAITSQESEIKKLREALMEVEKLLSKIGCGATVHMSDLMKLHLKIEEAQ